jgi:hypothetical protein
VDCTVEQCPVLWASRYLQHLQHFNYTCSPSSHMSAELPRRYVLLLSRSFLPLVLSYLTYCICSAIRHLDIPLRIRHSAIDSISTNSPGDPDLFSSLPYMVSRPHKQRQCDQSWPAHARHAAHSPITVGSQTGHAKIPLETRSRFHDE